MSHKTGPRMGLVADTAHDLMRAIEQSGLTISEAQECLHEVNMWMVRIMLRPWENETCPTCPRDMKKHGDKILALKAQERT